MPGDKKIAKLIFEAYIQSGHNFTKFLLSFKMLKGLRSHVTHLTRNMVKGTKLFGLLKYICVLLKKIYWCYTFSIRELVTFKGGKNTQYIHISAYLNEGKLHLLYFSYSELTSVIKIKMCLAWASPGNLFLIG
jgi:hypothetical protein